MVVEPIRVRALGPLEVGPVGGPVRLGGPRQRGLLALLVARVGHMVSMDELITGLWGDDPPASARKTVQGYAAVLRRQTEPCGVPIESTPGGGYRLASGRGEVDITVFEDLASSALALRATDPGRALELLADAGRLWRGRAFADVADLPGIEPVAVQLDERRRSTRELLLDLEIEIGDVDRAVAELELFTREDPWREQPWLLLVTGQFRQGRQAEALRSYERMRVLWAEAGLSPTPALREASSRISTDQDPRPDQPNRTTARAASMLPPKLPLPELWPVPTALGRLLAATDRFVGRRAELAGGEVALRAARDGSRQIVLVSGEPGAGKTRLAAELARVGIGLDTAVLFGGAEEGIGVPFQPLVESVEQLADLVGTETLTAWAGPHAVALGLLSEQFGAPPVGNDFDGQRFKLFSATASILRVLTAQRPVLWVLDDLQWTSRPMCQLLAHVARSLADTPLTILITYRDTDVTADHPLVQLVADYRRTHGLHELRLGGLDDAEVLELVGESLVESVRARAGGNPFFVTELARHLRDGIGPELPAIDDVVLRRVHRLPQPAIDVLRMAAVYGPKIPVRVLASAMGESAIDVADCFDLAVDARLAEPLDGPVLTYAFPHALVRDAIYGSLRTADRLRSHLAVARALEALHHDRDGVANDLALHWVHAAPAGYVQEAVHACRLAARVSRARLGLDEAVSHLERALDLVSADPTQPERGRASLLVELARANGDAGRFAALLEWAIEAGRVATAAGLDDLVVASALAVPGGMSLAAVASDRRIDALLKAALALTDPASDENLMLRAKRMTTKFFVLDVDSLAAVADELLDAAQTSGHPHVVRAVAEDVAWYSRRDQHKRCVDLLRDAVDPTDPLTELPYLTQALDELYGSGDGRGFRTLFSVFTERATGSISYAVAAAFGTATLTLFDGDLTKALHQARHARHLGMVERRVSAVTSYAAFALHVAWLQGRLDRMVRLADWAWHDRPHPSNEALRAWAHAANGNEEPLRAFVANFSNIDRLMLVSARFTGGSLAALTHAAVHTGQQPALSLAGDLWAEITERFHGGFFPPDLAVNHFRAMLAHARGDLDQAEDYFRQAIIDHGSLGSAPHRSISQHELAALLTTRGRSRDGDEIHLLQTATSNGRLPGPC